MMQIQNIKIDKNEVVSYLKELEENGVEMPGARALREHFKKGSFSTYNRILQEWNQTRREAMNRELESTGFRREDLEGELLEAFLPIINKTMRQIVTKVRQKAQEPLDSTNRQISELTKELEELERENSILRTELSQACAERENTAKTFADKIEELSRSFAEEKAQLSTLYEEKLRAQDESNKRWEALLSHLEEQYQRRPGRPRKEVNKV